MIPMMNMARGWRGSWRAVGADQAGIIVPRTMAVNSANQVKTALETDQLFFRKLCGSSFTSVQSWKNNARPAPTPFISSSSPSVARCVGGDGEAAIRAGGWRRLRAGSVRPAAVSAPPRL